MYILPPLEHKSLDVHWFLRHINTEVFVGDGEKNVRPSPSAFYFEGDTDSTEDEIRESFSSFLDEDTSEYEVVGIYVFDDDDRF